MGKIHIGGTVLLSAGLDIGHTGKRYGRRIGIRKGGGFMGKPPPFYFAFKTNSAFPVAGLTALPKREKPRFV